MIVLLGDVCILNTNSTIIDSIISTSASAYMGGGVFYLKDDSNTYINNSTFARSISKYGSAVYVDGQAYSSKFLNNTFKNNIAYVGGIIFFRQPILYDKSQILTISQTQTQNKPPIFIESMIIKYILASNSFIANIVPNGNIVMTAPSGLRYNKITSSTSNSIASTLYVSNRELLNIPTFQIVDILGQKFLNNTTCAPTGIN